MKVNKIIFILVIIITLLLLFMPNTLASGGGSTSVTTFEDMWKKTFDTPKLPTKMSEIIGIIIAFLRNVSIIVTVLVLTILGVKYMLGSVNDKADYKKDFPNIIIGLVLISGIFSIISAIFSIAEGL